MDLIELGPERGRPVDRYGSHGVVATPVATLADRGQVTCLHVAPDGLIGEHAAPVPQLFLVTAGSGWVAGPDGIRRPVEAGTGIRWYAGERHGAGSDAGMTVLVVEWSDEP